MPLRPSGLLTACFALSLLCLPPTEVRADWPQFRGPTGDGHAAASATPPLEWSEQKNVRWKTALAHTGWSTPVVSATHVWVTAATPDGRDYHAFGLDRDSGRIVHEKQLFHSDMPEPLGNSVNGYASPSPLLAGGRVFLHFGSYGTAALDAATGAEIWRRTDLPCRHYRGPGSSLAAYQDTLILTMDGVDVQYLIALDQATGQTRWQRHRSTNFDDLGPDGKPTAEGDYRKAYTTPIFVPFPDQPTQLISIGARATWGYDAATGAELWHYPYKGFSNASSPLFGHGHIYINTGYGKANLHALRLDGKTRGALGPELLTWEAIKRIPLRGSPVLLDQYLYMVDDGGFASCLDALTGEVRWSERLESSFSGSLILAHGHIIAAGENGTTWILRPTPEKFEIVHENKLDTGCLASPAACGPQLFLRTKTHLYCLEAR